MNERTRNRIQVTIIVVLLLAIAAMAYKFIVVGAVEKGEDARTVVLLEPGERAFVLAEMRGFLAGLDKLTAALAQGDMKAAAAAARPMGMAAAHDAPASIVAKLPLAFKTLAFGTHRDFDAIAADAERLGDPKHTLTQLAAVLGNCVACHGEYQFRTPSGPRNATPTR